VALLETEGQEVVTVEVAVGDHQAQAGAVKGLQLEHLVNPPVLFILEEVAAALIQKQVVILELEGAALVEEVVIPEELGVVKILVEGEAVVIGMGHPGLEDLVLS